MICTKAVFVLNWETEHMRNFFTDYFIIFHVTFAIKYDISIVFSHIFKIAQNKEYVLYILNNNSKLSCIQFELLTFDLVEKTAYGKFSKGKSLPVGTGTKLTDILSTFRRVSTI